MKIKRTQICAFLFQPCLPFFFFFSIPDLSGFTSKPCLKIYEMDMVAAMEPQKSGFLLLFLLPPASLRLPADKGHARAEKDETYGPDEGLLQASL